MKMTNAKIKIFSILKRTLSSDYFPIFTAVIFILNYYIGFDLINIYIYGIVLITMIILLDDLTPVFSQLLFLAVIVSKKNSPMYGESDYYTSVNHIIQIACLICVIFIAVIWRIVKAKKKGDLHITSVSASVIILGVVYILNGLFSSEHGFNDFIYGLAISCSLIPFYMLLSCTVKVTEENIRKICIAFCIFSILLVIELLVAIFQLELPITQVNADFIRLNALKFGWGMWNNMGMLLVICIAPILYLSLKMRYGSIFIVWGTLVAMMVIVTTSRQAYVGVAIAYCLSIILVLIKSRNHKSNYIVFAIMVILVAILGCLIIKNYADNFIEIIIHGIFNGDGELSGGGRLQFFKLAWENFISNPILGVGFYADNMQNSYTTSMAGTPLFYHNTFAQLLGSCGIVGLIVYIFHRGATIRAYLKNRSIGTSIIAISILAYLIMNLFDNHMFYILSAFIYPAMIAVITNPTIKD